MAVLTRRKERSEQIVEETKTASNCDDRKPRSDDGAYKAKRSVEFSAGFRIHGSKRTAP